MSTQIQRRRGTTTEHGSFTGAAGEITVDTTKDTIVIHDGSTAGGHPLAKENNPSFTGNVGIGTSSPGVKLEVSDASDTSIRVRSTATGSGDDTYLRSIVGGTTASNYLFFGDTDSSSAGYLRYQHSTDSLQFRVNGSERLRVDSSGRLLVGTSSTSSQSLLIVEGFAGASTGEGIFSLGRGSANPAANSNLGRIRFSDNSHTRNGAEILSASDGAWATNDYPGRLVFSTTADGASSPTERMRISSNGNVGIGTSSPSARLSFGNNIPANGQTIHTFEAGNVRSGLGIVPGEHRVFTDTASSIVFGQVNASDGTTFNERVRIAATGNVGIGTDSPQAKLSVNGRGQFNIPSDFWSYAGSYYDVDGKGGLCTQGSFAVHLTSNGYRGADSKWVSLGANSNTGAAQIHLNPTGYIAFNTEAVKATGDAVNVTQRMTIASDGNVGIGTSSPSEKLSVSGNGTFTGTVSAQGSVLTSDQRFKENITDAHSQLADVTALGNSLRNWDWTADAPVADKDTRFLGLVAQEAETICPGIVTTIVRTKDGDELTPEVVVPAVYETRTVPAVLDEEGEVVEAETTEEVLVTEEQVTPATYEQLDDSYKGIKNDILIMKLLGAVAELSAEVAALKAAN